jgi:hypothetical protein
MCSRTKKMDFFLVKVVGSDINNFSYLSRNARLKKLTGGEMRMSVWNIYNKTPKKEAGKGRLFKRVDDVIII